MKGNCSHAHLSGMYCPRGFTTTLQALGLKSLLVETKIRIKTEIMGYLA